VATQAKITIEQDGKFIRCRMVCEGNPTRGGDRFYNNWKKQEIGDPTRHGDNVSEPGDKEPTEFKGLNISRDGIIDKLWEHDALGAKIVFEAGDIFDEEVLIKLLERMPDKKIKYNELLRKCERDIAEAMGVPSEFLTVNVYGTFKKAEEITKLTGYTMTFQCPDCDNDVSISAIEGVNKYQCANCGHWVIFGMDLAYE